MSFCLASCFSSFFTLFAIIVLLMSELYDTFCHMSIKLNLNMTKKA
nr:MAG TPA: hypothetical protein [Caudoviricetes sp.]